MRIRTIGVELVIGFVTLFLVTKFLGKTQISQLTPFDFISAIVLGELLGNALYDEETGIIHVLFVLILWAGMLLLVKYFGQKSFKARNFLEGKPTIVIRDGLFDIQAIRRNRMNLHQITMLLRQSSIFSVREVKYGILETDGSLSVLRYYQDDIPTRQDLKIPEKKNELPLMLISDGKVLVENINLIGFNVNWLKMELDKRGIQKFSQVFYAEWKDNDGLLVQKHDI